MNTEILPLKKSSPGLSPTRKWICHLIFYMAPTSSVCHESLQSYDFMTGHTALGICFLPLKYAANIAIQRCMVLTWHPHEVWRVKAENCLYSSDHIWQSKKKKVNPVRMLLIVFGNKAAAQQLLFNTQHTGAGWCCSDVSNGALHDACLQCLSYLCLCFHSSDELEGHTWRATIRDWDEENQFQSPKDSWCRRSLNTNSCFAALESWGGFYLTTATTRQERWNCVASLTQKAVKQRTYEWKRLFYIKPN